MPYEMSHYDSPLLTLFSSPQVLIFSQWIQSTFYKPISTRFILILSSHLRIVFLSGLFPIKNFCAFLISPVLSTWSAHPILWKQTTNTECREVSEDTAMGNILCFLCQRGNFVFCQYECMLTKLPYWISNSFVWVPFILRNARMKDRNFNSALCHIIYILKEMWWSGTGCCSAVFALYVHLFRGLLSFGYIIFVI